MAKIVVDIYGGGSMRIDADRTVVAPYRTYEYVTDVYAVDFDYDDGFVVVRTINERGYLCSPVLYVPKDRVVSIQIVD
ncbi:MAG: hypothetical protein IJM76_06110 [Lachnospiraceae bacterium]|nr:hypothetical protein [Lachnospiraceae bacterium]